MIYCNRCGSPNNGGSFCQACGNQLNGNQPQPNPIPIPRPGPKKGKKKANVLIPFILFIASLGLLVAMAFTIKEAIEPLKFIYEETKSFSFFKSCHNVNPLGFMDSLKGDFNYVIYRESYKASLQSVEQNQFIYYGIALFIIIIMNAILGKAIKKRHNILFSFFKFIWNIVFLVFLIGIGIYVADYFLKTSMLFDTYGYIIGFIAK